MTSIRLFALPSPIRSAPDAQPVEALIPRGEPEPLRGIGLPIEGAWVTGMITAQNAIAFEACNWSISHIVGALTA
jgi:hypothetical protein